MIQEPAEVVARVLNAKKRLEKASKPGNVKVIYEKNCQRTSVLPPNQDYNRD